MAATDELDMALLTAIRDVRRAKGACTVRELAEALGLTVGGVQHRLAKAEAAGLVEHSEAAGSIRVTLAAGDQQYLISFGRDGGSIEIVLRDGVLLDARVAS